MTEGEGGSIHLDVEAVLLVHAEIFGISIDAARDRVLKPAGLASAVNRRPTYEHYRDADLALQGAVLAHGIAEGQIFVDGNKRTGLQAMRLFLAASPWLGTDVGQGLARAGESA